ncbi:RNA polymerase sigma factor [Aquimonas sp.]|jgi:RNA polymerase sigma-70 factor (ECF subfamily)|uniref:RNA polymerase sigma factor n=1 Tax=Aquimonas sp. TaxID=1872588 RepID=UPI0037BF2C98
MPEVSSALAAQIEALYRSDSRRVLATLIRLLGDFELAEDAVSDAFAAAMEQWPSEGIPGNPVAWLVSAGRFKAIDRVRRRARFDEVARTVAVEHELLHEPPTLDGFEPVEDDRLRLMFTCCHPALAFEAQIALTLREVCGLTTEEIARSFLTTAATLAQRIVRAKNKIRAAKIPYVVPSPAELPARLDAVLKVVYLVFTEGYAPTQGEQLTRGDLSGEAIRLGRLLVELLPEPEVQGLLALMLLTEARRAARSDDAGELVLLEHQDRSRWDRDLINEGCVRVQHALRSRRIGPYSLQAAIAAVHAEAAAAADTDWRQIAGLYEVLQRVEPSAVVALNRAVAIAMCAGPQAGLDLIDALIESGQLQDYCPAHAAQADLLRRLGRTEAASLAYARALALSRQGPEQRYFARRLAELAAA